MHKWKLYFAAVIVIGLLAMHQSVQAQLLEDRGKLKTAKVKRDGFRAFKKQVIKPKKVNRRPDVVKPWPVPFTKELAGKYPAKKVIPRFTPETAGRGTKYDVQPRFSPARVVEKVKVSSIRYSTPPDYIDYPAGGKKGFMATFVVRFKSYRLAQGDDAHFAGPQVKRHLGPSNYVGGDNSTVESYQKFLSRGGNKSPYAGRTDYLLNVKKQRIVKNAHPSANYLNAKYNDSRLVRTSKRKINVVWVRIFGNKTRPDGVNQKVRKAKFDKDEKDIWYNEPREYTRK